MFARSFILAVVFMLGSTGLFAQTVPVRAKLRTTTEIILDGKVIKTTVGGGFFYRASNGSSIRQLRKIREDGTLGDVIVADLTDKEHNITYRIDYTNHRAWVTPASVLDILTVSPGDNPPPGGYPQDSVETISCVKRPVRRKVANDPPTEVGYSCVSERNNDLELTREVTEPIATSPGRAVHSTSVLYDIELGKEPDPTLFDLKDFTISKLPDPKK
ncbi:MAG TPA: hypothetical protein VN881_06155 [Candidatus Acidoferrales bacterium]|nr:hypothetical protein [Candidatus Acidoferrales bacterium]